jgi:primosomal protein N' (replication factor Y) (superfamily II helicase)
VPETRAVSVITEVAALDRAFDYLVTDATARVARGDRVRVELNHRSVRGWVVGEAPVERELKGLVKWLGYGPPERLVDLAQWASRRWYAPMSRFLAAASPPTLVRDLPEAPPARALAADVARHALDVAPGVLELAPTIDPLGLVLAAYLAGLEREGSLLVLVPTEAWSRRLRARLAQRGCAVATGEAQWDRMRAGWPVIVGPRGAALAPAPRLAAAVVLDADDESYRSSAAPTWDAVSVVRERCRRDESPLWLTSIVPSPFLLDGGRYERVGGPPDWARIEVVDRRNGDPRDGALTRPALEAARRALDGADAVAVAVVAQRLGGGRLLACARCGELARCATCGQAEVEIDGQLACRERHEPRARFCTACGSTSLKALRRGVSTLARDVAAQLSRPVSEVTAATPPGTALERVVVGTEALWPRVRRCAAVVFADFDQYLWAPRESAAREAVAAVGRASRLVGSRREGRGVVVIQTRRGDDAVIRALSRARFDELVDADVATAKQLALPPYGAIAEASGDGAAHYVSRLEGVTVRPVGDGFVVRARDVATLTAALRAAERPAERLRIAVH